MGLNPYLAQGLVLDSMNLDPQLCRFFLGYSAVFMKKGWVFKKESTVYGNIYYKKE
jgi:hypothetical protein